MTTAEAYEELRPLMFSIAYRMLGQASEAEDVVQEAFLRYHRAQADDGRGGREGESTAARIDSPKAYLSRSPPGCASTTCAPRASAARRTPASGCPSRS